MQGIIWNWEPKNIGKDFVFVGELFTIIVLSHGLVFSFKYFHVLSYKLKQVSGTFVQVQSIATIAQKTSLTQLGTLGL